MVRKGPAVTLHTDHVRGRAGKLVTVVGAGVFLTGWALGMNGHASATPVTMAGIGLLMFAHTFLAAFEQLELVRLIQDLPTTRLRSAPQGYVEVRGIVQPGAALLTCPACGLECYWFQYLRDKGKKKVTPAGEHEILVSDGTGRCRLNPAGAELVSTRRGENFRGHQHICPGDPVFALGEFRTAAPPAPSLAAGELATEAVARNHAAAVRQKVQWLKYDARRMAVFDVNRDDKLDARELEAMEKVAAQQVRREQAAAEPHPDSRLGKPTNESDRLPFVIVIGSERDAIAATRQTVLKRAVVAVATGLMATAIVFTSFEGKRERADRAAAHVEGRE